MDKTIKVNPELFRISTPKKSKRNKTAKRGQSVRKKQKNLEKNTNTLKKALIKKIQAHQERQRLHIEREQLRMKKENERLKEKLKAQEKPPTSFAYLKKLQENVKERKQRREEKQLQKQAQKQAQKQEVKPYLQELLKNESIVPKKIQPISLGKQTSNTSNPSKSGDPKEPSIFPMSPVPEPSTPIVLKEPPPYGILKGGSKPLYSSYRKTRKQQERLHTIQQRSKHHTLSETHPPIHVKSNVTIEPNTPNTPELEQRRNKLLQIKSLFKKSKEEKEEKQNVHDETTPEATSIEKTDSIVPVIPSIDHTSEPPKPFEQPETNVEPFTIPTKLPMPSIKHTNPNPTPTTKSGKHKKRIRRTTRRKYQVGKIDTPKGKKVHLLVKNRKTRKKQLMEGKELKKTPILEVRKYLRERNLIRVGSQAPEHVLRQLYEASRFTGDVENKSSNVLLHNYMNTDGQTDGTLEPVPQAEMNYDVDTFLKEINGQTSTTPGLGDTSALDAMLVNK